VWEKANSYNGDKSIVNKIKETITSLHNLAVRVNIPTMSLIERAEAVPILMNKPDNMVEYNDENIYTANIFDDSTQTAVEASNTIKAVRGMIDEDEFKLLVDYYVKGITLRDIATDLGIKASTALIRIKNIKNKVKRKYKHENLKTFTNNNQGH
jgi:DNA-directed RNA polymerase specialized sigma24 family protein